MVLGVTLDIPVCPWSSGRISPIFLLFCHFHSGWYLILRTLTAGHREPARSFPFWEQLFPKRPRWKRDADSDPCLKERQFFPKFLCPDDPIWAKCSGQSVPMEQGVPREGSLEGAKAAAVQGKGHSVSPSSQGCCPHVAPQVTTRHCQPCPSKSTLQALPGLWEKGFSVISRAPLQTRLAPSVLAEGKAQERAEDIPHCLQQGEHKDWDLSLFIYFTTFLLFIVTDGCQVRGAENDAWGFFIFQEAAHWNVWNLLCVFTQKAFPQIIYVLG